MSSEGDIMKDDQENYKDNDYATKSTESVPVQSDDAKVEDPISGNQDSDAQLERDEKDAIDESNIVEGRTRGAAPPPGQYREPGDEEGLGLKEAKHE